jgi:hypothetical protein
MLTEIAQVYETFDNKNPFLAQFVSIITVVFVFFFAKRKLI